ncbi:MAG: copper resistance protein B [Candidatus Eutrophobiaceae bacterium]
MLTQKLSFVILGVAALSSHAFAADEHRGAVYHSFHLETGIGGNDDGTSVVDLDFKGWIGTDENKLWLKSESEHENGVTGQAEFWVTYSWNTSTFWDTQISVRHDTRPSSLTYSGIGFAGLAPYFFETEAHLFVSEDGDLSARVKQENEFLITQKLITKPYVEANLFAQDVPELEVGAGLSSAEFGVQMRYEFTRSFTPYIDVKYERKFGKTSSVAKNNGEDNDALIFTVGMKINI